jgi:hypothetical protein
MRCIVRERATTACLAPLLKSLFGQMSYLCASSCRRAVSIAAKMSASVSFCQSGSCSQSATYEAFGSGKCVSHPTAEAGGLDLDSTAILHTFAGVQLWLHHPIHQGVLTKRPYSSNPVE